MTSAESKKRPAVDAESIMCMRWCSDACEMYYDVELNTDDSTTCGIMHEPIHDIKYDALPSTWTLSHPSLLDCVTNPPDGMTVTNDTCVVNCVTLPCKHKFHVSALAVHFALNDMRCPICREGSTDTLCVQKLNIDPLQRNTIMSYVNASAERSRISDMEQDAMEVEFYQHTERLQTVLNAWTLFSRPANLRTFTLHNLNELLSSNLLLLAHVRVFDTTVHMPIQSSIQVNVNRPFTPNITWQTRLLQVPSAGPSDSHGHLQNIPPPPNGHISHHVHRSFRRSLFATLNRMSASDSAFLHFTIDHPLLPHALFTQPRQISAVGSGDVCIDIETPHVDFRLGTINILHSSNAITVTLHTTAIEMVNASIHPFSLSGDTEFILMPR